MQKQKRKSRSTTYKKRRGRGRTIRIESMDEDDETLKLVHGPEKLDPEEVAGDIYDEASKLKFPPPRRNPTFRKIWMGFVGVIVERKNFKEAHLATLEILCDLYAEYADLRKFIRTRGRTYKSLGRNGTQFKFYPEVELLTKCQQQIQIYMRTLGLDLKKEKQDDAGGSDSEKGEWD